MHPPLFVYGSLRPGLGHRLARWLEQRGRPLSPACYQGRLYDLGAYPGTVASRDAGDSVLGELFLVREPDAVLARLDAYEGCLLRPPLFRRSLALVTDHNGQTLEAWIYLYARSVARARLIVSGDYIHRCSPSVAEGARSC
jgi:gamma-glutamylcyclotransferase (GGCT)/AIG2-like uncharacterized protein YtfP